MTESRFHARTVFASVERLPVPCFFLDLSKIKASLARHGHSLLYSLRAAKEEERKRKQKRDWVGNDRQAHFTFRGHAHCPQNAARTKMNGHLWRCVFFFFPSDHSLNSPTRNTGRKKPLVPTGLGLRCVSSTRRARPTSSIKREPGQSRRRPCRIPLLKRPRLYSQKKEEVGYKRERL